MTDFAPAHPGEILLTEFLGPMGISRARIAKVIDVSPRRINEIVHVSLKLLIGRMFLRGCSFVAAALP